VRSSSVQEALNDAATRAAAGTPAMADLVRQDTDSRNEIRALRSYLSGEQYESRFLPAVEAQMRARIGELEKQRVALHQRIKASFPEYEQLVRPTPSGVDAIAGQLKTGQALLMLLPTDDAVYAWVAAAPATVQFIRVPMTLQRVAELVRRLRDTLDFGATGGALRAFDIDASAELYRALLKPLEGMLRDKTELVVTAAGPLAQLPFGVLATSPQAGAAAPAEWLIQRSAITHVPSIASWLAARRFARTRRAGEAMMGWADPLFDRSAAHASSPGAARSVKMVRTRSDFDFSNPVVRSALDYSSIPPLPDTRDELVSIARRLNADPLADLKFGEHATKDSVLAASKSGALARKRVVAFATHGLMARDLPALSEPALALANTASKDPLASLLTLEDVLNLKLNADWVVLSACNTAAADGKAEEALSGLARGFFYAGTRSLLVTHWAVETDSATQLTTGTFAYYADHPEASKAESLRQAMLALMQQRDFAHPAFWAPYALVGDGSR
jgi:CHAT domain-containing protein